MQPTVVEMIQLHKCNTKSWTVS